MSEYTVKAKIFLKNNGITFSQSEPAWDKLCPWDKSNPYGHALVKCVFRNKYGKSMTVNFWDSLMHSGSRVTSYDVLSCLTKYEPGTFEQFCIEFGYNTDSITALNTYKAVCKEYKGVKRVFGHCMEQLQEIY